MGGQFLITLLIVVIFGRAVSNRWVVGLWFIAKKISKAIAKRKAHEAWKTFEEMN